MKTVILSGSTDKTKKFLDTVSKPSNLTTAIDSLAQRGVAALQAATPKDSGYTAAQWGYEIEIKGDRTVIQWTNNHIEDGVPIAIVLQYGHATGTGGYVSGRDFINPAIQPVFDEIADSVWKKVTLA